MDQTTEKYNITIPDPIIIKNGNNIIWKNVKEFLKISKFKKTINKYIL